MMQRFKIHDVFVKDVEPDAELRVWEDWIRIRKYEAEKLAFKMMRPPVDHMMNQLVNVREEMEWKTAIEYAQIEKKVSVRGTPWEQPYRLPQRCYYDPVYEIQRTKAELGKPPIIEHICVPHHIQKTEMGMTGESKRVKGEKLNAEFLKYRNKRETDLAEKLKYIDPFRPSCSNLIVIGKKPKIPPPKLPPLPVITINGPTNTCEDVLSSVYAIKINNTIISKDIPQQSLTCLDKLKEEKWHEKCTSWSYYFNNSAKRAGRCKISLENIGTVTLRYCWKQINKSIPFIPPDSNSVQVFFFNKNEDVLSPGQQKDIYFTFLSSNPGIYSESWELSFCNICFFDTMTDKLTINLYGDAVENIEEMNRKIERMKQRIDKVSTKNMVLSILRNIITEAVTVKPQLYPYKHLFIEAEIFVMKNPVCYYHQTTVAEMKQLYEEMEPNKQWDLSIGTWRQAMMAKDYDDRMKYYQLLRKCHSDLLKPWYEGEELAKTKYRTVKFFLGLMADNFDKVYDRLIDIYSPIAEEDQSSVTLVDPETRHKILCLFYLHAYDYVVATVELCAGMLSSLDLNRWIEFDFCR